MTGIYAVLQEARRLLDGNHGRIGVGERMVICMQLDAALAQRPVVFVITDENINHLQVATIRKTVERCKHAHHTDLCLRINGQDEVLQADWIKHMTLTEP